MDFEEHLIQVIERARSPSLALHAAAEAIARDELSDACAVFLLGPEGRLALWASSGDAPDTRDAQEQVAYSAFERVGTAAHEHAGRTLIAAPLLSHVRPIGALVVERGTGQPYQPAEARRLVAIASQIAGVLESARLIDMIEHIAETPERSSLPPAPTERGERVLRGIGAAPGIAIGRCVYRQSFPRGLLRLDTARGGPDAERARLRDAFVKTRNDLKRMEAAVAGELGEEHALVFGAHLVLLADPGLQERIEHGIAQGLSAALAVDRARSDLVRDLGRLGDAYIAERVEDLEDLCARLLTHLLGAGDASTQLAQVVVTRQITPSLVVELHGRGALAIASEVGAATSHAVLLARALGFPAVTGVAGLLEHTSAGEPLVVDGDAGLVILAPSEPTLDRFRARQRSDEHARTDFARYRDRAPTTADGVRFSLRANVAFGTDIALAATNNAEGIGLYRTEFPFIVHDGIPTLEDQTRIYARACKAFPDQPVVFRILDLAADKLLPRTALTPAPNAFQGYRSIRLLFDHPHVLREQVQAFALAAAPRAASILIPMVSSIEELRRVKKLVASALADHPDTAALPPPQIGVLIEVPAAVEIAADLARESDFISIGTNDLMQYALVIDRDDQRLSTPSDAYHPAVLRMVRSVVRAAHEAGKGVTVCGELAARPELALALLALGVDTLSVSPRAIPELKQRLAPCKLAPLARDIDRILALPTAAELEQAIAAHAPRGSTA